MVWVQERADTEEEEKIKEDKEIWHGGDGSFNPHMLFMQVCLKLFEMKPKRMTWEELWFTVLTKNILNQGKTIKNNYINVPYHSHPVGSHRGSGTSQAHMQWRCLHLQRSPEGMWPVVTDKLVIYHKHTQNNSSQNTVNSSETFHRPCHQTSQISLR